MRIDERIVCHQDNLSPQERRAAVTMLEHLDDLATYRAAELAVLAGVSKATMSRLFRSLGYADFDEVRADLRSARMAGVPGRTHGKPDLTHHVAAESEAIAEAVRQPGIEDAIRLLAAARRVMVVGWRNSHPVALHLRQQLAHARSDVRLAPLPGQVMGEELADLVEGDVVLVVGFRRRPSGFGSFVRAAAETHADLILLADPSAVGHAARARVWLECPTPSVLAYDSYAAAMSIVGVLADGVLTATGRAGRERVSRITRTYEELTEIE